MDEKSSRYYTGSATYIVFEVAASGMYRSGSGKDWYAWTGPEMDWSAFRQLSPLELSLLPPNLPS